MNGQNHRLGYDRWLPPGMPGGAFPVLLNGCERSFSIHAGYSEGDVSLQQDNQVFDVTPGSQITRVMRGLQ
jgi:hypothetical protein